MDTGASSDCLGTERGPEAFPPRALLVSVAQSGWMFSACGPFWPCVTS